MSVRYARVPLWWTRELRGRMLCVAVALAAYADAHGAGARPTIARLAADTGLDVRHVRRALIELRGRGVIAVSDASPGRAVTYAIVTQPRADTALSGPDRPRADTALPPARPRAKSAPQTSAADLEQQQGEVQEGLERADAVAAVVALGADVGTATRLVERCGASEMLRLICVLQTRGGVRRPVGWLVRAAERPGEYRGVEQAAADPPRHGPRLVYSAPRAAAMPPDEYSERIRRLLAREDAPLQMPVEEAAR